MFGKKHLWQLDDGASSIKFIRAECLNSLSNGLSLPRPVQCLWNCAGVEEKEALIHLHLQPRRHTLAYTRQLHTSSIKALHSLLQLSIRKLSLGFRALAYRHLYEAFSAKCSKHGPSNLHRIYREWLGGRRGEEVVVVLGENSDNKYIHLKTRLFRNRWIYIPQKSKLSRWVGPGLLLWYLWTSEHSEWVCKRVREREYRFILHTIHS